MYILPPDCVFQLSSENPSVWRQDAKPSPRVNRRRPAAAKWRLGIMTVTNNAKYDQTNQKVYAADHGMQIQHLAFFGNSSAYDRGKR
jgi:hypothetical protein